ncbi:MAG: AraC family transcriptional regulator [Bacillus sp. (in: Bacteria)]|nr:AraC family transcriptional regulator [Bacillus sp. (in: firmicutes)]
MAYRKLNLPESGIYLYESIHKKEDVVSDHFHEEYQILYALDGEGEITVDGIPHPFTKDNAVFLVPNSPHSIHASSKLTVLVLDFSEKRLKLYENDDLLTELRTSSKHYDLDPFNASEVRQQLRKLLFEQNNSKEEFKQVASSIFILKIFLTLARVEKRSVFSDANEMRSARIQQYINNHYFENIRAETLASKFGISTRYMNDIFKEYYQETPMQYLQHVRMNKAKALLLETDKEIITICFEVGYETVSTFYRSFKNTVGTSPHKYRMTNYIETTV